MNNTIYISRRCKHCHELLIILHKYKSILSFPIVDIDKQSYPTIIKSVPCMIVDNKILPGSELFKFIEYLLNENKQNQSPMQQSPMQQSPMQPPSMRSSNSQTHSGNVPEDSSNQDNDTDMDGFCFNNSCLNYSSLEGDDSNIMSNYELLDSDENTQSCKISNDNPVKGEKIQQFDSDYERLTTERNMDMR